MSIIVGQFAIGKRTLTRHWQKDILFISLGLLLVRTTDWISCNIVHSQVLQGLAAILISIITTKVLAFQQLRLGMNSRSCLATLCTAVALQGQIESSLTPRAILML